MSKRNQTTREPGDLGTPLSSLGAAKGYTIQQIDTPTRARELSEEQQAQAAEATTPLDRSGMIHDWMVRGWYFKGQTDRPLAAFWGVALSTVHGYSAAAWNRIKADLGKKGREELLTELLVRVNAVGQSALERTEEVVSDGAVIAVRRPDHRTALRAAEVTGELLGLKIQRHHHVVTPAEMTTEQIVAQLEAQGVKVQMPLLETTAEEKEE